MSGERRPDEGSLDPDAQASDREVVPSADDPARAETGQAQDGQATETIASAGVASPESVPGAPRPARPDAEELRETGASPESVPGAPRPVGRQSGGRRFRCDSLIEYFTLRRAIALEAMLGDRARVDLASALALGIQKAEAAETLWENGHSAEGLRLGAEALEATLLVASIYAQALGIAPVGGDVGAVRRAALEARGMSAEKIAAIETTLEEVRTAALPIHERDVAPSHTALWRRMAEAQHQVACAFRDAARTRRELRLASAMRIAGWALVGALALGGVWLVTRPAEGLLAEASGTWAGAEAFSPDKAIDGRPDTWWLAPDGVEATLEVRISPPRRVERIRLRNGTNPPHYDRGTRDYILEVYAEGRKARSVTGTLGHSTAGEPEPVEHEIGLDRVERVRFIARTHYGVGAGLAELEVE